MNEDETVVAVERGDGEGEREDAIVCSWKLNEREEGQRKIEERKIDLLEEEQYLSKVIEPPERRTEIELL